MSVVRLAAAVLAVSAMTSALARSSTKTKEELQKSLKDAEDDLQYFDNLDFPKDRPYYTVEIGRLLLRDRIREMKDELRALGRVHPQDDKDQLSLLNKIETDCEISARLIHIIPAYEKLNSKVERMTFLLVALVVIHVWKMLLSLWRFVRSRKKSVDEDAKLIK